MIPLFIPDSNLGIRRRLTPPRCVTMPPKRKAVANTEKAAKRARGETDLSDGLSWGEAGPATRGVRPLLHLTSDTLEGRDKVAGFDIDWTVIKTKSGRKFASGETDDARLSIKRLRRPPHQRQYFHTFACKQQIINRILLSSQFNLSLRISLNPCRRLPCSYLLLPLQAPKTGTSCTRVSRTNWRSWMRRDTASSFSPTRLVLRRTKSAPTNSGPRSRTSSARWAFPSRWGTHDNQCWF